MIFRLTFQNHVRPELRRWRATLGDTPAEQREWFHTLIGVMTDHLRRHGGRPPDAVLDPEGNGSAYWWWFANLVLIRYRVDESPPRPRGWWDVPAYIARLVRPRRVTVTVVTWAPAPGRPADRGLLPG